MSIDCFKNLRSAGYYTFMMFKCVYVILIFVSCVLSFPDPGQWSASYSKVPFIIFGVAKPLYSGSSVFISVNCETHSSNKIIELQWVIRQTSCFEDCLATDIYNPQVLHEYFICPMSTNYSPQIRFFVSKPVVLECSNRIHLEFTNASFTTYSENDLCIRQHFTDNAKGAFKIAIAVADNFDITKYEIYQLEIPPDCQNTLNNLPTTKNRNTSGVSHMESSLESTETHIRGRRNTSLKANSNTENDSGSTEKLPVSVKSSSFNGNDKIIMKKTTVNYALHHKNETFPSETNGYISGPFSASANIKPGSPLATVDMDGIYLFILKVRSIDQSNFNISVDIAMKGDFGFLSAVDYPLLLFYGIMCGLYVIFAIGWLVMSALQWRDLLRIQFWIGAVILLGLMEKAVFYAEYQSINYTGQSVQGAILFAEILSCMKRTLARMLIIIVSLGFGIVKPRLGPMLHRIIGVGALYFCLGTIEGCLRVLKPKTDPGNQALMAGIPLAVTDSAICWWIFSSLVQTIRTLRLRRNIVKLQLYRHFTNTLLLSVIGSVAFMTWSIHAHKLVNCITDWKELWVDEAYWHFLFSVILFVIMILWRPTNNNQRYAFTPLLDAMDDDEDEDEDNHLTNDAFVGMKMRTTKNNSGSSPKQEDTKSKQDEDLKWVEENIPSSLTDVALPSLLDSDEEIMTAKFERSKME